MTELTDTILVTLEDIKAQDVKILNVEELTSITDWMIIATGTSKRHIKATADKIIKQSKSLLDKASIHVEGLTDQSEWVLIDLGTAVIHVMTAETRDFYQLEKIWSHTYKKNALAS